MPTKRTGREPQLSTGINGNEPYLGWQHQSPEARRKIARDNAERYRAAKWAEIVSKGTVLKTDEGAILLMPCRYGTWSCADAD